MAKRQSQMDRAIADVDAKIALVKVEQERRVEQFKLTLDTMAACRALLVAMKTEGRKQKTPKTPRAAVAPKVEA